MSTTITFYELSAYNDGRLVPKTFDLDDYADQEDFAAARAKWLEELTEKTGHLCEEWIVADFEGVPREYVGEWDLSADFWTWREAFTESRLPLEVFEAGAALGISPENISEAYVGTFDRPADFALELEAERGTFDSQDADLQRLLSYVDWDWMGRDLTGGGGYGEENHHYFVEL